MSAKKARREDQVPTREGQTQYDLLKKVFYSFAEEVSRQFERLELGQHGQGLAVLEARLADLEQRQSAKRLPTWMENQLTELRGAAGQLQTLTQRLDRLQDRSLASLSKEVFSMKNQFNGVIEQNAVALTKTLEPLFAQVTQLVNKSCAMEEQVRKLAGKTAGLEQGLKRTVERLNQLQQNLQSKQSSSRESLSKELARVQLQSREEWDGVRSECQSLREEVALLQKGEEGRVPSWERQLREQRAKLQRLAEQLQSVQEYFQHYKEQNYKLGSRTEAGLSKLTREIQAALVANCQAVSQHCQQGLEGLAAQLGEVRSGYKGELEKLACYVIQAEKGLAVSLEREKAESRKRQGELLERAERQDSLLQLYRQSLEGAEEHRRAQIEQLFARMSHVPWGRVER